MNRLACLALSLLLVGSSAPTFADTNAIAIGQFLHQESGSRLFRYGNEGLHVGRGAEPYSLSPISADPGSMPVFFLLSADDLPLDLSIPQDSGLSIGLVATGGTTGIGNGSVPMFESGAVPVPRGASADQRLHARASLLTVTFANTELAASQSGGAFTFMGNDDSVVTYTSDFLEFGDVLGGDFAFSFSGTSPKFAAPAGGAVADTRFSGTGGVVPDRGLLLIGVPGASIWVTLSLSFGAVGVMMRTGRRQRDLYAGKRAPVDIMRLPAFRAGGSF